MSDSRADTSDERTSPVSEETTATGDRWERLAPRARIVAVVAGIVECWRPC